MASWQGEVGDLIAAERDSIVEGVMGVEDLLVPRLADVARSSRRSALLAITAGMEHFVRGELAEHVVGVVEDGARQRMRDGYTPLELVLLSHAFMPPLRRALVARFGTERGLELYQLAEPRLLAGLRAVALAVERAAALR